ncbi:phosphoribosylglycinamide synthetase phosphoribosylamine-glycine ligase [Wigglesworthia glossinidia endosymbiont of Glossina morsitans morsitans (Yale colony)]|uniref:Phosphoribosylamine--glycine ligase n=1 Tax=Wigglesworthia glossinidia endosymbiont of Glossina morsitans morsitans (Yale colony) TaxID=1142511 RepID=H6Q4M7_WIGGL|nr:phosphoribosylamine--glycine ligase [Wigglesworthia glossinidia]AFA41087.1 phosphoribosylglycinamide synthetase phosphoribosylamine-glycine ligase [Wigglesworthia glossinidia endosymbiont of Glossina morsitans morsitans (Yale colony)]
MKILVIGSGGREHAISWKIAQSSEVKKIYVAPGNGGTFLEPKLRNINIASVDIQKLISFAKEKRILFTIVGPEEPLYYGIVDAFMSENLLIFGPTKFAAQLETSKVFAKKFLKKYNIPSAKYKIFYNKDSAIQYVKKKKFPIVIKADGLSFGKGVKIAYNVEEAEKFIEDVLINKIFNISESSILIEEMLYGEEISFTLIINKTSIMPLAISQDHKRVGSGDIGNNTGGMGAYSPVSLVTYKIYHKIMQNIIYPTISGMIKENLIYTGILYVGILIDKNFQPYVIEFNCRFGDPEAQTILFRMKSDFLSHILSAIFGNLDTQSVELDYRYSMGLILATSNYPESYPIGLNISGLFSQNTTSESKIFHCATKINQKQIITNGGRVLCVTSLGNSIENLQEITNGIAKLVHWNGKFFRKDIGHREKFYCTSDKKI